MVLLITGDPPNLSGRKRRNRTFRWLARDLARKGIDMILVTPRGISYRQGKIDGISGWRYKRTTKRWQSVQTTLSEPVWLDFMYLSDLKRHATSYHHLLRVIRRQRHPYANHPFASKQQIYEALSNSRDISPACIPETKLVQSVLDIQTALRRETVVWLKPTRGSGGRNIVRIAKQSTGKYHVSSPLLESQKWNRIVGERALNSLVERLLHRRKYLLQEEINLPQTADGRRIDVRVTVGRDREGDWQVTATTLRVGESGAWVTNYHAGGQSVSMRTNAARQLMRQANLVSDDVLRCEIAAIRVARVLQMHNPNLAYLGIDVAPMKTCCYVYDCNTKPGRDILTNGEVRLMMQRLAGFSAFLLERRYDNR